MPTRVILTAEVKLGGSGRHAVTYDSEERDVGPSALPGKSRTAFR